MGGDHFLATPLFKQEKITLFWPHVAVIWRH